MAGRRYTLFNGKAAWISGRCDFPFRQFEIHCIGPWMAPGRNLDPLAQALRSAGATSAEPYTFRMLSADCKMVRRLVGRDYQVWAPATALYKSLVSITGAFGRGWAEALTAPWRKRPKLWMRRRLWPENQRRGGLRGPCGPKGKLDTRPLSAKMPSLSIL